MHSWQLLEARKQLGRVIDEAIAFGPQTITLHGVEVAVVLSFDQYRQLTASRQKLSAFFGDSQLVDAELDHARDTSAIRDEFVP